MIRLAVGLLPLAALLAPLPAQADTLELAGSRQARPPPKPAEPDKLPVRVSLDAGVGYSVGATQIGAHTYAQIGAKISAALRVGRIGLSGGYEVGSTNRGSGAELINGQRHRFSLALGVDAHRWGGPTLFGETHVGAGIGREFIAWEQGSLSRRDAFVVVEQTMGFRLERGQRRKVFIGPKELLYTFGLQVTASSTPPLALQPITSGPETGGDIDMGFLFSMGIRFRR